MHECILKVDVCVFDRRAGVLLHGHIQRQVQDGPGHPHDQCQVRPSSGNFLSFLSHVCGYISMYMYCTLSFAGIKI